MTRTIPDEWKNSKGKSYDTRFLYTGFSRYDVEKKMLSQIKVIDGRIVYVETPCDQTVFSRSYTTEHARVTVYSESPRIWSEELSPNEIYFLAQQPTQAVSTR
jgi:hypothetical protein